MRVNLKSIVARLIQPILVIIRKTTAHAFNDHKYNGRREDPSYDDKQQFHAPKLTLPTVFTTPATVGRLTSAEMATDCSISRGISAHIPFSQRVAMLGVSQKEDSPWMNSAKQTPKRPAEAGLVSLLPPSLSFWFCFMRSLRAGVSAQPLIPQLWVQLKVQRQRLKKSHLRLKKQPQRSLLFRQLLNKPKTTHTSLTKGGRSDALAFYMRTPLSFNQTEVCPC